MYVLTADYAEPEASEIFVKSLKETGFGVLKNHPINIDLIKAVYAEWAAFFASEEKHRYVYNKESQDGFFPQNIAETAKGNDIRDIKEFYHFYPWGKKPEGMSDNTLVLYQEMSKLAGTLLQWVESHTPSSVTANFSRPLSTMIEQSPMTLMRILHYPPLTGNEQKGAVRAAAHEDIDLMTLLVAATETGLEVKDSAGNWHKVESDPGSIVVNAGDMLQMCSNYYYKSTTHRVVNPTGENAKKSRLSIPLFLHPRSEVRLSAEHTAKSYLWERLKELGVA
jgi:isopenicillin N synthase-like dioxygenase